MTQPFEIRRRIGLYLAVALVAVLLAAGFGALAVARSQPLWWIGTAVLAVVAAAHLLASRDGRTPVFVADDQGIRLRAGREWIGLLWQELGDLRVERRDGRHDARVKVVTTDGRHVYEAPLGFTTTCSPAEAEVQLARRRRAAAY